MCLWIRVVTACDQRSLPVAKGGTGDRYGKDRSGSLSIEELAALRDAATEKLAQKVMARQAELESLSQYGKLAKKSLVAPAVTKPKKGDEAARKNDEAKDAVAKAA